MSDSNSRFTDEIREAVRASDLGVRQLAEAVGASHSAISRFRNGGGIELRVLDALAALLALRTQQNKAEARRRQQAALREITRTKGQHDA